jgi:hypothetical protein
MMRKKNENDIKREFRLRQTRQIIAMTVALFLVMLAAVLYKRPDLVGAFSKGTLFGLQAISIAAFVGYTVYNWRCPSCDKHLGGNVHRQRCGKCGALLQ